MFRFYRPSLGSLASLVGRSQTQRRQHFSLEINSVLSSLLSSHTSVKSFKMGYGEVDQTAINTIRLLAVSLTPPTAQLPLHGASRSRDRLLSRHIHVACHAKA